MVHRAHNAGVELELARAARERAMHVRLRAAAAAVSADRRGNALHLARVKRFHRIAGLLEGTARRHEASADRARAAGAAR
jgi:hypothetical protein